MALAFCGQEECSLDSNGRVKLSAAFLRDFQRASEGEVILHCLPEGAVAIYPPTNWQALRADEGNSQGVGQSVVQRRAMRRFGAVSLGTTISNQGRVTIPARFRQYADLGSGMVILVGCEIGVEIWNPERWQAEFDLIQQHVMTKSEHEMTVDLNTAVGADSTAD